MMCARDAYRLSTVRRRDVADSLTWPGTRKLAWRFPGHGMDRTKHVVSHRALVRAARRFVPELKTRDVHPGPVGVRPQARARDGHLVDDFVFAADRASAARAQSPPPRRRRPHSRSPSTWRTPSISGSGSIRSCQLARHLRAGRCARRLAPRCAEAQLLGLKGEP